MSSGRTLGKYELREQLGKGGMAEVWKAFQPGLDRFVAIKLMHKHLAADDDFVERFRREAKAVGQLQHNNIMRVIDFDIEDDEYYMVMDYIQGGTLSEYIQQKGSLPAEEALQIMIQLADGLGYAHQQGMVHRDIKPANVMFMDESASCPVLTDFGIARILSDQSMTMTGAMIGTPAYMSPEAIRGEKVDGRADIYSLGVMLYEMLVGRTPYTADTPYGMILKQMHDPLPLPSEVNPDVPEQVEQLILKALEKEVEERYQSALEFRQAILDTLEELTGKSFSSVASSMSRVRKAAPTPNPSASAYQTIMQQTRKKPVMAAVVGGVLLMALLMVGFVWVLGDGGEAESAELAATPTTAGEVAVIATPEEATPTEAAPEEVAPTEEVPPTEEVAPTEEVPPTEEAEPTAAPTPTSSVVEAEAERLGALRFMDKESVQAEPARSDYSGGQYSTSSRTEEEVRASEFFFEMDSVPSPPAGSHYELWLADEEDQTPRNLGELSVENGKVQLEGSTEENLIGRYSRVLISIEPDDDPDSAISEEIPFTGVLPAEYTAHIRQLVGVETVRQTPFLLGASQELRIAIEHSGFLEEALAENDLSIAHLHAEHIVNILDGEGGDHFGDLDQDGDEENPGDGFGVRGYLEEAKEQTEAALQTIALTQERQLNAQQLLATTESNQTLVEEAIKQAKKIWSADSLAEAERMSLDLNELLEALLSGIDEDGNGVVDLIKNEGGILAAYELGLLMAEIEIFAK